jgi:PIN domain nuclease of toxin-antitoxin system
VRLLLDTHVLLWALNEEARLGPTARSLIGDVGNDVLVSVASLWEIAIKSRLGKLVDDLSTILAGVSAAGFHVLPIEIRYLTALGTIAMHHRDPFDHLLLAQAATDGLTLMTVDRQLQAYGVPLVAGDR